MKSPRSKFILLLIAICLSVLLAACVGRELRPLFSPSSLSSLPTRADGSPEIHPLQVGLRWRR